MSKIDTSAHYRHTHEWIRPANDGSDEWICGISDHAQEAMSDIAFVGLPRVGDTLQAGDNFGTVESVKAVSDVYVPLGGTITAVNSALENDPSILNSDPYGEGWLIRLKLTAAPELNILLNADAYAELLKAEEHSA